MLQPDNYILIVALVLFVLGLLWRSNNVLNTCIKGTILLLSLYGFYLMMYLKGYVIHIGG